MRFLCIAALLIAPAFAQQEEDLKDRFDAVSASAAAWIRSADSIEARLNRQGSMLHPQIVALRTRLTAAVDQAHEAIEHHDKKVATRALKLAEELTERLAHKLGG